MKIRNGFVSNSSSSSFIVAFPRAPKDKEEVRQILFGAKTTIKTPYDDNPTSTDKIASTIWNDIKPQQQWSPDARETAITDAAAGLENLDISDFILPSQNEVATINHQHFLEEKKESQYDWGAYYKESNKQREHLAKHMLKIWEGKAVYVFKYGDENGAYESVLEHGNIFEPLPHEQISKH